jgi:hypothetical protein
MTPVLGPVEAHLVLDLAGLPSLREHILTRRVLAALPAHEHYRPQVGARSAGELARHIDLRVLRGELTSPAFALGSRVPNARDGQPWTGDRGLRTGD